MRMKRRDFAATLMAVLMAGSKFAGCGSADKNVNHNVETTQNIQNAKDVQFTTQAVADNETKATNAKDEKEIEEALKAEDEAKASMPFGHPLGQNLIPKHLCPFQHILTKVQQALFSYVVKAQE